MKRLIVSAAGLGGYKGWDPLIQRLSKEEALDGSKWYRWDHHKRLYSGGHFAQLAGDLRASIDAQWSEHGPFDDLILVGHSAGGLLMRMAFLLGAGEDPVTRQSSPWADRVSRIILLAGLSRG